MQKAITNQDSQKAGRSSASAHRNPRKETANSRAPARIPMRPARVATMKNFRSYRGMNGWVVFGLFASPPDPLGQALTDLRVVRSGGHPWSNEDVECKMRDAGFGEIKSFTPPHLARFTVGRRPHFLPAEPAYLYAGCQDAAFTAARYRIRRRRR